MFTGRWVETTEALNTALKRAVVSERDRVTEFQEYGLLAQPNESGALSITTLETYAGLIVDQAGDEVAAKKVNKLKDIQNSGFYVVKFVSEAGIIHAVKKVGQIWRTRRALSVISVLFSDNQLDINTDPSFEISKAFDFFIVGDNILIMNKANFESVLSFKEAHKEDFNTLQREAEFMAVFAGLDILREYVGENKIQLRRASAIRQKGHYKNPDFMRNLRDRYRQFGLNLTFDGEGRIVPSAESCRDIFQALLDHRLTSLFSNTIYDVPDAAPVSV